MNEHAPGIGSICRASRLADGRWWRYRHMADAIQRDGAAPRRSRAGACSNEAVSAVHAGNSINKPIQKISNQKQYYYIKEVSSWKE